MLFHKLCLIVTILFILIISVTSQSVKEDKKENEKNEKISSKKSNKIKMARPSVDGQLHVEGTMLVNSKGEKVILKGLSSHGLTWYSDYINKDLFTFLSEDWGINIIRLSMYSENYIENEEENLKILRRGIEAAIASDIYALIDWHILDDYDPMMNVVDAKKFFDIISKEYANVPNLIFEICNEMSQGSPWESMQLYSKIIIPVIRQHSPNAVIIAGTPDYDHDLESAMKDPLEFDNIMYSLHFYTAINHDDLIMKLENAIKGGLPVFVTECSITMEDGDGRRDYEYAVKWFDLLSKYNINFVFWNLSNKKENCSIIRASSRAYLKLSDNDLSGSGKWIRSLIKGMAPSEIPQGDVYEHYTFWESILALVNVLGNEEFKAVKYYGNIAVICSGIVLLGFILYVIYSFFSNRKCWTYDQFIKKHGLGDVKVHNTKYLFIKFLLVIALITTSLIYLTWRITFSINKKKGALPIICNIVLLVVEIIGFFESCILYTNLLKCKVNPLPVIEDNEYPDVDIFIATYNESEDLLRKTLNGCKHLDYPDKNKVHIWLCDDNRRSGMKRLAKEMGVGYFDRPDNKGAKAGNLNNALSKTTSPYVVTLDADMIVKSDFLLKTIPYFVYVEKCNSNLPNEQKRHLGLLQTPQCFYDPDVFQYNLYSETRITNEQDFFYRGIEVSKTSSNSVVYGGSNTILSRKALNDIGGFYTKSITEDFATGLMIEAKGYLSLATPEPLASGMTPNNFNDHIKQRTRWARGVISVMTNKEINPLLNWNLHFIQKLNYISSAIYWYSPIKNFIYIISPFFFALFGIPVFRCNFMEILMYWLPMFIIQYLCIRIVTGNMISIKWVNIYETSIMPFLFIPVLKETLGITKSKFKVTEKSNSKIVSNKKYIKMIPFFVIAVMSIVGIVRIIGIIDKNNLICMLVLLYWILFNLYTIIMIIFMINGRERDEANDEFVHSSVVVRSYEIVKVRRIDEMEKNAITSVLTEHSIKVFLNCSDFLRIGDIVNVTFENEKYKTMVVCMCTDIRYITGKYLFILEIKDYQDEGEYLQILYDRIPTLPQTIKRDTYITLFWRNIIYRFIRMLSYFYIEKPIANPIKLEYIVLE